MRENKHARTAANGPRAGAGTRLEILGLPAGAPAEAAAVFRGRLGRGAQEFFEETGIGELHLVVRSADGHGGPAEPPRPPFPPAAGTGDTGARGDLDLEARMSYFTPIEPEYDLSRLVLPRATLDEIHLAADTVRLRDRVFGDWGLHEIEPHPRSAIGLHGPSGTGKTMVAHALARHLGKRIIAARTSQLETKYHGEGGKYLAALFEAARRADAVLFVDEAESLLSRRFESVSQGAEHAVNGLRTELMQLLDRHEGIVVFATNLAESYDPAISTRLHHVHIPRPDFAARRAIWRAHLPQALPGAAEVAVDALAAEESVVGRDIKRVVVNAAVAAARRGAPGITQEDLETALANLLAQRPASDGDRPADAGPSGAEAVRPATEEERDGILAELRGQVAGAQ